jgi:cis-3-alkyl-4-acyloxetan-2-one decarboxylase
MGDPLEGDFGGTFPFEPRYIDVQGIRLHYVDEGDGAPVLLLHGNPTWSYMWREPIRHLSGQGHRCVAPDHMGFGRSDKPAEPRRYRLRAHIDNLLGLIDALDLHDVTLVMHDWGGPIGIGAALERSDRVRALVAMNTWAWQIPSFLPPFLRQFRSEGLGELLALGGNLIVESIPGGMANREPDPVMMDAYRAPFPDYWSRIGPLAFQRDIPLTEADPSAETIGAIQERLSELDVPLLLVWGMRDPVFRPVFVDQWRELFPHAELVEIHDASHYLVEDRPDLVSEAIESFLAARPG